jgi:hemoglobin
MKDARLFDKIGADALRGVVADFYSRLVKDAMIGFMFQGKDHARLVDKEYELAAALLGAPGVTYTGRPMRAAHNQLTVFGGQFERRAQILRETLADHHVDPEVRTAWLDHVESLRSQITRDRGSECSDPATSSPGLTLAPKPPDPDTLVKLHRRGG